MSSIPQYFSRLPKSLTLSQGAPQFGPVSGFEPPTGSVVRTAVYSRDGSRLAYAQPSGVTIVNPVDGSVVSTLAVTDAADVGFSPRGSFVLTWERPRKDEESGNFGPNLKVWDAATGQHLESFLQKTQGGWSIQYTYDEKYCARLVSSSLIHFYESSNLHNTWSKLQAEGISEFSLSPGQNYSVAVFIPEKNGKPASVRVFQIPNFVQPVCQKTFFKADKVQMKWNKLGTALLVLASTDVDHSGKSYYGETNLYLLGIAGSYDSRIALDKEGTIHDFAWSPNSREFGVVYGFMPAKTTIFDSRGNEVHSLPVAPRNTLQFSPHGRFVLVAGFGNLQGTVDIYDRQKQFAKIASFEASNTSVCEWSPDGRCILTATTSPRLRVDNGIRIWHYTGKLLYAQDHDELFSAVWRPEESSSLYPLRASLSPAPAAHESTANIKVKASGPSAKPAGAYRPPHARSAGGSAAPTSLFQRALARDGTQSPVPGSVPGAGVPGATPAPAPPGLSRNAARNKKKREAKKTNDEDEAPVVHVSLPTSTPPIAASVPATAAVPATGLPEDKKVRSLLKKLRAIEELKQRQAVGDSLEATQVQKIQTENAVRADLAALGWAEN